MWSPLGRRSWSGLLQHSVNLLEREPFGFGDEEVGKQETETACAPPYEKDLGPKIALVFVDNVRRDDGNDLNFADQLCAMISESIVPLTQFQSQLEAVESATPRARMGSGNISPMTTHAAGPQVVAKKPIYRQVPALMQLDIVHPDVVEARGSWTYMSTLLATVESGKAVPTAATMNSQTTMPAAPTSSSLRRPAVSTK